MNADKLIDTPVASQSPNLTLKFSDGAKMYSLATENYVKWLVKQSCEVATSDEALNSFVYHNGPNNDGIGATLSNSSSPPYSWGTLFVDGQAIQLGDRVLVKNQFSTLQNGIYELTQLGSPGASYSVLTRSTDFDSPYLITMGSVVAIEKGTQNALTTWMVTSPDAISVGTSPIDFDVLISNGEIQAIVGTANQITVTMSGSTAILSFADNPIFTGTGSITIPGGTSAQQPQNLVAGMFRFDTGV